MQELNKDLFIYINSLIEYDYIRIFTLIFADLPIFFLPIFLILLWIYYTFKEKNIEKKNNLLYIFYASVIAMITNFIIKLFVDIERPDTASDWSSNLILDKIPENSFPSDHAAISIAFAISLFFAWYKKTWVIFLVLAIFMNFSRIVVGVHWPLDILAWTLIWVLSAIVSFKLLKKLELINKLNILIIRVASLIKL